MAEPFALDEPPASDNVADEVDLDGKIQCPECDKAFKPTGLKRHITMVHRGGISDSSTGSSGKPRRSDIIQVRWADFQRGAALLVSLACTQCANALSEDAEKDAIALAQYCETKPKFRKQVEQFLTTADFLLLVGAFGGTAQKMISHHSIASKIPGVTTVQNTEHTAHSNPMERMADYMTSLPPEQRHRIIDQAMEAQAKAREQTQEATRASEPPIDTGAGGEPQPDIDNLTNHDEALKAAMNSGSEFMETVPLG